MVTLMEQEHHPILIKDNVFDTASIGSNYESSAIFLNTADQSTLGTLSQMF